MYAPFGAKENERPAERFVQSCLKVPTGQQFLCNSNKQEAIKQSAYLGAGLLRD